MKKRCRKYTQKKREKKKRESKTIDDEKYIKKEYGFEEKENEEDQMI